MDLPIDWETEILMFESHDITLLYLHQGKVKFNNDSKDDLNNTVYFAVS